MTNLGGVQACHEIALATNPSAQGGVTILFSIAPEGHVQAASVTSNSTGNAKVDECILNEVKKLRFPAAQKPTGVSFPFVFKGGQR